MCVCACVCTRAQMRFGGDLSPGEVYRTDKQGADAGRQANWQSRDAGLPPPIHTWSRARGPTLHMHVTASPSTQVRQETCRPLLPCSHTHALAKCNFLNLQGYGCLCTCFCFGFYQHHLLSCWGKRGLAQVQVVPKTLQPPFWAQSAGAHRYRPA